MIKLESEPKINNNPEFKKFFACLNAMKTWFVTGCKPWFHVGDRNLKGPYGRV